MKDKRSLGTRLMHIIQEYGVSRYKEGEARALQSNKRADHHANKSIDLFYELIGMSYEVDYPKGERK